MATTAIVAEILIAGLQALVWITLLVLTIFGTQWVELNGLEGWEGLTTIFVLATAYVLGFLVDRAADITQGRIARVRIGQPVNRSGVRLADMRMAVLSAGGTPAKLAEEQSAGLRVTRATALNLLIGTVVVTTFLGYRTEAGWGTALAAGSLLALALVLTQLAFWRSQMSYLRHLEVAYRAIGRRPD